MQGNLSESLLHPCPLTSKIPRGALWSIVNAEPIWWPALEHSDTSLHLVHAGYIVGLVKPHVCPTMCCFKDRQQLTHLQADFGSRPKWKWQSSQDGKWIAGVYPRLLCAQGQGVVSAVAMNERIIEDSRYKYQEWKGDFMATYFTLHAPRSRNLRESQPLHSLRTQGWWLLLGKPLPMKEHACR